MRLLMLLLPYVLGFVLFALTVLFGFVKLNLRPFQELWRFRDLQDGSEEAHSERNEGNQQ